MNRLRAAACGLGAGLLLVAVPVQATATTSTDPDDGLWYFTKTQTAERHETTTGKGVQIAVIDTAINPDVPELQGVDLHVREPSYCAAQAGGTAMPAATDDPAAAHGTGMVSLIVGNGKGIGGERGLLGIAPDAEVHFYANMTLPADADVRCPQTAYDPDAGVDTGWFARAIDQAVADGADIISISLGVSLPLDAPAVARALHAGVVIVAAEPDDDTGYPARLNGVVGVDSIGPDGQVWQGAGGGKVVAPGEQIRAFTEEFDGYHLTNGSSSATAYTAGALALVWSAYPDATANQILQTLVRNTDGEDHELYFDEKYGYGVVNVRHMLEHDPTTYPDENPLLSDDPDAVPSIAEIADPTPLAAATPSEAPTAAPSGEPTSATSEQPTPGDDATADDSDSTVPLLVGAAAIVAALVAVVGLAVRRARSTRGGADGADAAPPTHRPGQDPRPGGQ